MQTPDPKIGTLYQEGSRKKNLFFFFLSLTADGDIIMKNVELTCGHGGTGRNVLITLLFLLALKRMSK